MCQIVSEYMQTSNFACFCILVTAIRVFTTPTHGQPSVAWNCGRFARSSCFLWLRECFWRTHSSSRIQLSWRHRWNRKCIVEIGLPVGWLCDCGELVYKLMRNWYTDLCGLLASWCTDICRPGVLTYADLGGFGVLTYEDLVFWLMLTYGVLVYWLMPTYVELVYWLMLTYRDLVYWLMPTWCGDLCQLMGSWCTDLWGLGILTYAHLVGISQHTKSSLVSTLTPHKSA